jgi:PBP1b-binding outer membrane lipoprotein LpoB
MKKFLMLFATTMLFVACGGSASTEGEVVDTIATDTTTVDSVVVDTVIVD